MRRWLRASLLCAVVIGVMVPGCGRGKTKEDALFLWKVTSGGKTVYLLGSVHVGKAEFYPLPAEIEDAFEKSNTLVVEVDPDHRDPGWF